MDRSLFIAGAAGEGVQTIGDTLARGLLAHGYFVFACKEYESRIRGGSNSYRIRISDRPRNAPRRDADVLLALNDRAKSHYLRDLAPGGVVLDASHVPFTDIAEATAGARIFANAVAAGALCAAVGLPLSRLTGVLRETFHSKGDDVVAKNVSAAEAGYRAADPGTPLPPLARAAASTSYAGAHETIPLAAAAAGCRFVAAYPMSPSTGIITAFARDSGLGVFAEQAEDEIAAINMAIGASAAGARAMTATSGGGFALMTEGLSLAGMIETPLVLLIAQRPGPATGLPTRTAQEDLLFAIRAGHGEFPRAVLAPSDPQDAIYKTLRAFALAERYQCPVILLTDQFLADAHFTLPRLELPDAEALPPREAYDGPYARYRLTASGISPRMYLGEAEDLVVLDSDEHDEEGHITEDLVDVRPSMVEKRWLKARGISSEIAAPEAYRVDDAETVLIGWGSTRGALMETVDRLRDCGRAAGLLHFTEVWPLPQLSLDENRHYIGIEGNATGQFAGLLQAETGIRIETRIGRFDGLPLDASTLVEELT